MTTERAALLLDLDGVLVHELPAQSGPKELVLLHDDLRDQLARLPHDVFVLTHRSRAQGEAILRALQLTDGIIKKCYAAEDIALAGARSNPLHLLRGGLRKSLVLRSLAKTWELRLDRLCFVDDRLENLDDTLQAGLGLGMLAPLEVSSGGAVSSFSLATMLDVFLEWAASPAAERRLHRLVAVSRLSEQQQLTAVTLADQTRSPFTVARRWARNLRRGI